MIRAKGVVAALDPIDEAGAKGTRLLAGGARPADLNAGHFLEPPVLADVRDAARIMAEGHFAPIAPIAVWEDLDDVIARANATEYGLAAYGFTENAALPARTAETPFGGFKHSGFGRDDGSLGILDDLVPT